MGKKYKNETYKNIKIGFVQVQLDGWHQPKDKNGNNLPAVKNPKGVMALAEKSGFGTTTSLTKERAFNYMKKNIDNILKYEKNKSKVRNTFPSSTERIMANEW